MSMGGLAFADLNCVKCRGLRRAGDEKDCSLCMNTSIQPIPIVEVLGRIV
jgi:hypothetical protein